MFFIALFIQFIALTQTLVYVTSQIGFLIHNLLISSVKMKHSEMYHVTVTILYSVSKKQQRLSTGSFQFSCSTGIYGFLTNNDLIS